MREKVKMSIFLNKKILCLGQTPFQLLSLLSIFSDDEYRDYDKCDLVIWDQFSAANEMAKRIREAEIFSAVECLSMSYPVFRHLGVEYLKDILLRPEFAKKRFDSNESIILRNDDYDILLIGAVSRLSLDAKRYCAPGGVTFFFDDGAGSHNANVFQTFAFFDASQSAKMPSLGVKNHIKYMARNAAGSLAGQIGRFSTQGIFLFNPTDIERSVYYHLPIYEQKSPKDSVLSSSIFEVSDALELLNQPNVNLLFLLPDDAPREMLEKERSIIKELERSDSPLVVKVHPRRKFEADDKSTVGVIGSEVMWEVVLATGCLRSDAVLHGFASSAQIHPKTLFGLEPQVLFYSSRYNAESTRVLYENLKSLYANKNRVRFCK